MESTGVYWIPAFELLESNGFEVKLVNARHVKNVSAHKTDVLDCQWLQQLGTFGLLKGAFRPADTILPLRVISDNAICLLKVLLSIFNICKKPYSNEFAFTQCYQ